MPDINDYDGLALKNPPEMAGVVRVLHPPVTRPFAQPDFMHDTADRGRWPVLGPAHNIHGSFLVRRRDALLFGPNHLVERDGAWSCETRQQKTGYLDYLDAAFYNDFWPGARPGIERGGARPVLRTAALQDQDVERIDAPVFLATPGEPPIWGRWVCSVAPKAMEYRRFGGDRKFLCFAAEPWQRAFLQNFGIGEDRLLPHDPGRTYLCADVMTVESSEGGLNVNARERADLFEIIARHRRPGPHARKLFISRLTRSRKNPYYRALQNEAELAAMLAAQGFTAIEPEFLSFEDQVTAFAAADQIVALGGSGLYNAAFSAPGARVVTIESTDQYVPLHAGLLASLNHRYGIIFGAEDTADKSPWHRRWTLNVPRAEAALAGFFVG